MWAICGSNFSSSRGQEIATESTAPTDGRAEAFDAPVYACLQGCFTQATQFFRRVLKAGDTALEGSSQQGIYTQAMQL